MAPTVMASTATSVAPFQGLKSTAGLPVSRRNRSAAGLGSVSNGGRIRCMQVCMDIRFRIRCTPAALPVTLTQSKGNKLLTFHGSHNVDKKSTQPNEHTMTMHLEGRYILKQYPPTASPAEGRTIHGLKQ